MKNYLKSAHDFANQPPEKQLDILNTYQDYLGRVNHRTEVIVFFVCRIVTPSIKNYIRGGQFCLFPTRGVEKIIEQIEEEEDKHRDIIPEEDFMEKTKTGGIQNAL